MLAKQELKELFFNPAMGYGIYPMAFGQSEWDKFSGDRIPVNYIYLSQI